MLDLYPTKSDQLEEINILILSLFHLKNSMCFCVLKKLKNEVSYFNAQVFKFTVLRRVSDTFIMKTTAFNSSLRAYPVNLRQCHFFDRVHILHFNPEIRELMVNLTFS